MSLKKFWKIFLKGFTAIFPIGITMALLLWIYDSIETVFGFIITKVLGPQYYFPGLGVLIGVIFVFSVGVFMNAWIVQKIYDQGEQLLKRIPLVKTLYGSVRDLMNFFSSTSNDMGGSVVSVQFSGFTALGLITRQDFTGLPAGMATDGQVAVYIPMSYQFGGFTILVARSQITFIDMSIEQAMRFIVTAGMQGQQAAVSGQKQNVPTDIRTE